MQDVRIETAPCVLLEKPDTLQKHLFYPLQFVGGRQNICVESVIPSNSSCRQTDRIILYDIHITFPNGVMVSVGEFFQYCAEFGSYPARKPITKG